MTTSQVADAGTALMGFLGGFCAVIFLLIFFYVVFEFVNLLICVGDARVSEIRSEEIDELQTIRDFENFLREAGGFSKSTATSIVAKAKKLFASQRESEEEEKMATQLLERVKKLELSLS